MNKEQQRIKIAEACGWILNPKPHTAKILDWLHVPSGNTSYDPPDYFNDLNAMHEVEKALDGMDQLTYLAKLHEGNHYCSWAGTCATAAQRAEAFLRTLNLWQEGEL